MRKPVRRHRSALAIAALCAGLLPGAGVAGASASPVGTPDGAAFRTITLQPGDRGAPRKQTPVDLLRSEAHPSLQDSAEVTRALIEETWGIVLPGSDRSAAAGTSSVDGSKTTRTGIPAPDLSGDALADVLSYEVSFEDYLAGERSFAIEALRGTDGTVMWSRELSAGADVLPVPVDDVSGDDLGDVLVVTLASQPHGLGKAESCGSQLCVGTVESRRSWKIALLSGADGTTLWERDVEGASGRAYANAALFPPGLLTSDAVSATTAVALMPMLSSDHDGDGLDDIVLNVFDEVRVHDFQWTSQAGNDVFGGASTVLVATHSEVLSGDDGDVLLQREQDPIPGGAYLSPAGDLVGSPTGDLLWQIETDLKTPSACHETDVAYGCTGSESASLELEAIDGASLETAWTERNQRSDLTDAGAEVPQADLTGDGKSDLLQFEEIDVGGGERRWWMGAINGPTGEVLWRHEIGSFPDAFDGTILGAAGGGDGLDLLKLDLELKVKTQNFDAIFTRIDGATGKPLFSSLHSSEPNQSFSLSIAGDADADGVRDLIFNPMRVFSPLASSWVVESGASGALVNAGSTEGRVLVGPAEDLDGDGRSDLLARNLVFGNEDRLSVALLMPSGDEAWRRRDQVAEIGLGFSGDLSGAGGADVVLSRVAGGVTAPSSRVEALDGSDGSILWGHGDALPDPLPEPTPTASPSPTPSGSPVPSPTTSPIPDERTASTLTFTDASATAGQYGDESRFEARLTDSQDGPIRNVEVTFELAGADSSRTFTAVTSGNGVASVAATLDATPGPHQLTARFNGDDLNRPSSDTTSFVVEKEDTHLDLTIRGRNEILTARLSDADSRGSRIEGRSIDFYAGSESIGSAVTDRNGTATFGIPEEYREGRREFEARFEGDDYYVGSIDRSS